jgi:preprotein translocase SecE subunit
MQRDRYVFIGVIALAAIAAMPLAHALTWLFAYIGVANPRLAGDLSLTNLVAYCIAAASALFVILHRPTRQVAGEVVEELSKVSWPTRAETGSATIVVIVTVVICSLFLGFFDIMWRAITDWILGSAAS